ncbi:hypothetical protein [Nocardia otitidiscaviarum]|uniref:hypothetical protein n=1 Tax=Nocardia otitidiscaviarum TaxID=1823 RepID=UPI0004A6E942|nr:hypothetical protein [Nocardia otitidiscaviarum]
MPAISGLGLGAIENISGLGLGAIEKVSGLGLGLLWQAETFAPSGMTKNGNFTIPGSYTQVTSWTADTTGYPGSTLSGNGLVAQGSKAGASLTSSCSVTNTDAVGITVTLRLKVNGGVVATGAGAAIAAFGSGTATVSTTTAISDGDVVTLEATGSIANYGRINGGASSYVHIT